MDDERNIPYFPASDEEFSLSDVDVNDGGGEEDGEGVSGYVVSVWPLDMGNLQLRSVRGGRPGAEDAPPGEDPSQPQPPLPTPTSEAYNEDLPPAHSYLGENLEEVSGRLIYVEGSVVSIPLLPKSYGTLLPGQTFPLTVRDYVRADMLRKCVEKDHTFGCVASRYNTRLQDNVFYGTIAEIYEFSDDMGTVCIKAKGRQRFKVISYRRTDAGYRIGQVEILPEVSLKNPLSSLQMVSLHSLRVSQKEKCRQFEAASLYWPKWVYDMYDPEKLVQRCDKELNFLKQGIRKERGQSVMPKEPSDLSFWVGMHLDASERLFILKLNSPIQRLRWLLSFLNKYHVYKCQSCQTVVGKQGDVFAMSTEGAQSTFVNSEGYLHDTITLLKAQSLVTISSPSTHFSWFPGYAWSIAVCSQCRKHMGWQFSAVRARVQPRKFWGLTRQALDTAISTEQPPAAEGEPLAVL